MLSSFSVKKPYTVAVAVILIIILGVISFTSLTTDLLPNIDLPYILVITPYPGASPEKVEISVTRPMEQAVSTTGGLKNINSISQENSSTVILEFEQSTNMDTAMIELSAVIDRVSAAFDSGVNAPILMRINPDMLPIMAISVDAEGYSLEQLTALVEDEVLPALERTEGVGSTSASGMLEKRVEFTMNQQMIDALNSKVLAAVDKELADAEQEILDAREEIEEGKEKLEKEQKKRSKELAEAGIELTDGRQEVKGGLKTIDDTLPDLEDTLASLDEGYDGLIKAQEGYDQMITGRRQLKLALAMREDLLALEATLQDGSLAAGYSGLYMAWDAEQNPAVKAQYEAQLMAIMSPVQQLVAQMPTDSLPPVMQGVVEGFVAATAPVDIATFNVVLPFMQSAIPSIMAALPTQADLDALDKTIMEFEATIKSQYATMNSQMKKIDEDSALPDDAEFNTERRLREMLKASKNAKGTLHEAMEELPDTKLELEDTLTELDDAQLKLEQGRLLLATELAKAGATLDIAEKQLEQAEEAFEEARDEAYKNAGLDGVITKSMISSMLMAQNFSMPAGYIVEDEESYMVKVGDQFEDVAQLKRLILFHTDVEGVGDIYLTEVGVIEETDNWDDLYAKVNGNDGIMLTVQKQSVASTADVCARLRDTMDALEEEIPGLRMVTLQDQGVYIKMVTDSVFKNLLYGGALAVLVLIIFLRNWRPTLIIALSIPISLLFAIVLMYFSNVTLNIISLSGLALGVGMLVDNSIVAIENVYRLRNEGMGILKASVEGVKQIAGALTASTLTTVSVFVPIVFTEGITKQIFTDMGLTIGYSLVASLLVSLTVVPALGSVMLTKVKAPKRQSKNRIVNGYERLLRWSLKHKAAVLLPVVALLVFAGYSAFSMGTQLFPDMESNQMTITIETPSGSTNAQIREISNMVIEELLEIEDVDTVGAMQQDSSGTGHTVTMYVLLDEKRTLSDEEMNAIVQAKTVGMDAQISLDFFAVDMSMLTGSGISVSIKGNNMDTLRAISADIADLLAQTPGTTNVKDGTENGTMEVRITIDKNKAMRYNLTTAQIYQEIAAALATENTATTLSIGEEELPLIVIKDEALTRANIAHYTFTVTIDEEEQDVPLQEFATIIEAEGPASISHVNQSRVVNATAEIAEGYNVGLVSREFEKLFAQYEAPVGYTVELDGENEYINQAIEDVFYMILVAIAFIYLIMVAEFQSLLSPFIVLFTVPLAFTGGLLALMIFDMVISIVALIGMLMLAGVVVNNGIVFVDTVNQLRLGGMEKREALIKTGALRLRPIMMTAMTTILALFTMAFGSDMGAQLSQPLAIVTIGGLSYATILTLLVVPIMYDILHRRPLKPRDIQGEAAQEGANDAAGE